MIAASYDHLVRWDGRGVLAPSAPVLELTADGAKVRDGLGLAVGGIRLSQAEVPTALDTGDNAGETFCFLFGTHVPFDKDLLGRLYPARGHYVSAVAEQDGRDVRADYLRPADTHQNLRDAAAPGVGRR